jgi:hypothetical protein
MTVATVRIRCALTDSLWEPALAAGDPLLHGTRRCRAELLHLVPGSPPVPLPPEPWAVALLLAHALLRFRPDRELDGFTHPGFASLYDWLARANGTKSWFRETFGFVSRRGRNGNAIVPQEGAVHPDQIEIVVDGQMLRRDNSGWRQTVFQLFVAQHDARQWTAGLGAGTIPRLLDYLASVSATASPSAPMASRPAWDVTRVPRALEPELREQLVSGGVRLVAIRGPKQFGKTTLLESLQACDPEELFDRAVLLSFRDLNTTHAQTAEDVYAALREELELRLGTPEQSTGAVRSELQRLRRSLQQALAQTPRLWLLLDDVDRLFDTSDRCAQVFGTLSEWWSKGQRGPERELWKGLRMVLTHRRDPLPFFAHHDESSPFSRAQRYVLPPFSPTEVHALGEQFEVDAATRGRVLADLAGHPSLTCLAFESLGGTTWQALSGAALRGEGPLGQWMRDRAASVRLLGDKTWQRLLTVARGNSRPSEADAGLLERGLVTPRGSHLAVSTPLFELYLMQSCGVGTPG